LRKVNASAVRVIHLDDTTNVTNVFAQIVFAQIIVGNLSGMLNGDFMIAALTNAHLWCPDWTGVGPGDSLPAI
jgi:hypothetical protein